MAHELWRASCALLFLGLAATAAGSIWGFCVRRRGQPYAASAEARVVEIVAVKREPSALSEFRNRQAAVFEFFAEGRLIKVTDSADSYPCPYRLHQRVRISYNPDNPEEYSVTGRDPLRTAAAALRTGGIILLLTGCVLFFLYAARYVL